MKLPKNLGSILLAVWLILYGLLSAPFLHVSFAYSGDILAVLAIVAGVAALLSPTTAITDYPGIARAFAQDLTDAGGELLTGTPVLAVRRHGDGVQVRVPDGIRTVSRLVICAGLQTDLLARSAGDETGPEIVPLMSS